MERVIYYRYDNCNDSIGLAEWEVFKKTPFGVWIKPCILGDITITTKSKSAKFILNGSRKKFAWPTIEEARTSFKARKNRQMALLKAQVTTLEYLFEILDKDIWPDKPGDWTESTISFD